jgi:subtilase family serine protease
LAKPEFDRGPVNSETRLKLSMGFRGSPEQEAELDGLLSDLQDQRSERYHQWLTPEEYADRFGASRNDLEKIKAWLETEGFTIVEAARGRDYIRFSGTAGLVAKALGAEIHRYAVRGENHFANAGAVALPADLAAMVSGIRGLHDFLPAARRVRRPAGTMANGAPGLRRQALTADGYAYLLPTDLATIYDLNPVYSHGWDGAGQRIAIVGQSALDVSDIETFRDAFGLPFNDPTQILVPGSDDPGINEDALGEADLDIEWAGAVARMAKIYYIYGDDAFTAATWAIDQVIAPVLSVSFGVCEWHFLPDDINYFRSFSKKSAALGITWVASSGDSGAAGCENQNGGWSLATTRMSVSMPASLPEVTAVGGTEFNEGSGSYWSLRSGPNFGSALSYIPETAWNDEAEILQNLGAVRGYGAVAGGFAATGGGASIYFAKPAWQSGPGVPNDGARDVPDIAFTASGSHDPYAIVNEGKLIGTGGTSASAPVFAGILALLNEYLVGTKTQPHAGLGNINPMLYFLGQNAPDIYHDVTTGSNAVPCMPQSSQDCPSTGVYGYRAGPGYDMVTGWGSTDVTKLIATWAAVASGRTSTDTAADATGEGARIEHRGGAFSRESACWPLTRR